MSISTVRRRRVARAGEVIPAPLAAPKTCGAFFWIALSVQIATFVIFLAHARVGRGFDYFSFPPRVSSSFRHAPSSPFAHYRPEYVIFSKERKASLQAWPTPPQSAIELWQRAGPDYHGMARNLNLDPIAELPSFIVIAGSRVAVANLDRQYFEYASLQDIPRVDCSKVLDVAPVPAGGSKLVFRASWHGYKVAVNLAKAAGRNAVAFTRDLERLWLLSPPLADDTSPATVPFYGWCEFKLKSQGEAPPEFAYLTQWMPGGTLKALLAQLSANQQPQYDARLQLSMSLLSAADFLLDSPLGSRASPAALALSEKNKKRNGKPLLPSGPMLLCDFGSHQVLTSYDGSKGGFHVRFHDLGLNSFEHCHGLLSDKETPGSSSSDGNGHTAASRAASMYAIGCVLLSVAGASPKEISACNEGRLTYRGDDFSASDWKIADAPWAAALAHAIELAVARTGPTGSGPPTSPSELLALIRQDGDGSSDSSVFIAIKTASKYHATRLDGIRRTWLRDMEGKGAEHVVFITDEAVTGLTDNDIDAVAVPAKQVVVTSCEKSHANRDLCCKTEAEFGAFYDHFPESMGGGCVSGRCTPYQWYCHFDDDMYVLPTNLRRFLATQDHNATLFLGGRSQGPVHAGIHPGQQIKTEAAEGYQDIAQGPGATSGADHLGSVLSSFGVKDLHSFGVSNHPTGMYCLAAPLAARLYKDFLSGGRLPELCESRRVADDILLTNLLRKAYGVKLSVVPAFHSEFSLHGKLPWHDPVRLRDNALSLHSYGSHEQVRNVLYDRPVSNVPGTANRIAGGQPIPALGLKDRRGRKITPNFCRRTYSAHDGVVGEAEGAAAAIASGKHHNCGRPVIWHSHGELQQLCTAHPPSYRVADAVAGCESTDPSIVQFWGTPLPEDPSYRRGDRRNYLSSEEQSCCLANPLVPPEEGGLCYFTAKSSDCRRHAKGETHKHK